MMLRHLLFAALLILLGANPLRAETDVIESPQVPMPAALLEPPSLHRDVAAGTLPSIGDRLPKVPRVIVMDGYRTPGNQGGTLQTLVSRTKDSRLLYVFGYARLVVFNPKFELEPDIAEKVEVEDGRKFTFHLRPGHRWSDGQPFTSEDFRFWWEEVATNAKVSPFGPPTTLSVDGELPTVEFPDATTVVYTWSRPNPFFLPALAGARPLEIFTPAHYMRQFHADFADPKELEEKVKAAGVKDWSALYRKSDSAYEMDTPAFPTLQPWQVETPPPSKRIVATRNRYFHRIDQLGRQLPYIDQFVLAVTSSALIPTKTGAGETDLQARGISFNDYTFLKRSTKTNSSEISLWKTVRGSQLALYPNLNVNDPAWRKLLRDVRVRRALSLAINRKEINNVIYFGLGLPGNQSALPGSPFYRQELRQAWADYDLKQANALLDEAGLDRRDDDGFRLLPDGRRFEVVVETAGENPEEVDVLQLIRDSWQEIGLKMFIKSSSRDVLRNRIFAGETTIGMWFGYENALITADLPPNEFVPVMQNSYQWPKWGQYVETRGKAGEAVDLPAAEELMAAYGDWTDATDRDGREAAWRKILQINSDQVFTFGLVAEVPQPVVAKHDLHNLPETGIFNWEPGAQFGMYQPDSFWLSREAKTGG